MNTAQTLNDGDLPVIRYDGRWALLQHPQGPRWYVFTTGLYEPSLGPPEPGRWGR